MLNLIFSLLAIVATAVLYLSVPTLSFWWLLPIFIGAFVGVIILYFALIFVSSLFMSRKKPIKSPNRICRFFIWVINSL